MGHIGKERALGVRRVSCLLESVFKKFSLSEFFLSLLLNIGKTQKQLHVPAAADPDSFDLVVLGRTGISRAEGESEPAFLSQRLPEFINAEQTDEILPVLPVDASVCKSLNAFGKTGQKNTAVFGRNPVVAPVNIIGISLKVHKIDRFIVISESHDQVHAPCVLDVDLLSLRDITHDDQRHDVPGLIALGERDDPSEPDFVAEPVLHHTLDPEISLSHPVQCDQVLSGHLFPELVDIVREDPVLPFLNKRIKGTRYIDGFLIKYIIVIADRGDHSIAGDIDFTGRQCVDGKHALIQFLPRLPVSPL